MKTTNIEPQRIKLGMIFALFAAISAAAFGLFAYNSTYGYDQVEYLIIGRSLVDGYPFYTFAPSKGPGIYLIIAALHALGVSFDHASLSVVIAAVYLLLIGATFVVARGLFDDQVALVAGVLVGACTLFMALNFLQPTGFVVLAGLAAYVLVLRSVGTARYGAFVLAGLSLGIGFQFKSVAAFYGVGIGLYLLIDGIRARRLPLNFRGLMAIGVGVFLAIGLPFAYFALTGRAAQYYEWTFNFPLFHYPASTLYFPTLYTKLGWFHAMLFLAIVWSLRSSLRASLYAKPAIQLALCMGTCAYIALLKGQSAHYCYPGAVFFCLFIAAVGVAAARESALTGPRLKYIGTGVGVVFAGLMIAAGFLHKSRAQSPFLRFVTLQDYTDEREFAKFLKDHCPPDAKAQFFSGAQRFYWISHRYPAAPFVNLNVQTAHLLRKDPTLLLRALNDPRLALVEFDRTEFHKIYDSEQFDARDFSAVIDEFEFHLREKFVQIEGAPEGRIFWRRR